MYDGPFAQRLGFWNFKIMNRTWRTGTDGDLSTQLNILAYDRFGVYCELVTPSQ
jgi:hypothetical protein